MNTEKQLSVAPCMSRSISAPAHLYGQLCLLLALVLAVGGGGVGAAGANLVVHLIAIALLAWNGPAVTLPLWRTSPTLSLLAAFTVATPLLQLVPLPPEIWQSLPGRELEKESLQLIGQAQSWRPISVAPARTVLGLLGLVPAVTVLLLALQLPDRRYSMLTLIVVGGAVVVALGGVQMTSGGTVLMIYDETIGSSALFGTFANRNTSGVFLVIALIALIGRIRLGRNDFLRPMTIVSLGVGIVLCIAIVMTRSRSAMALTLVPLLYLASRTSRLLRTAYVKRPSRVLLATFSSILAITFAVGLLLHGNDRLYSGVVRFDDLQTVRLRIWEDSILSAKRFWPVGAGVGTYDEVSQIDESIEHLEPTRAGRAHNEMLEQVVESGILGLVLTIAWISWLGAFTFKAFAGRHSSTSTAAALILCCLAFQSVLDYPLRNQTLMCTAALLVAVMVGNSKPAPVKSISDDCGRGGGHIG